VLSYISILKIFLKYSVKLEFELNADMDYPATCREGRMAEIIVI